MSYLDITYNHHKLELNDEDTHVRKINKPILFMNDLSMIEEEYPYILIRNNSLKKRSYFDMDSFCGYSEQFPDVDIFILSSHGEKCHLSEKTGNFEETTFYQSTSPGEINAFFFNIKSWDKIKNLLENSDEEKIVHKIKNLVINNKLTANFAWPQVFYDDSPEFLNICRQEKESFINPRTKDISYYWFYLTIIFSTIFIYLIYNKLPKDRFFYVSESKDLKSERFKELK